jgi:DNA-binding CsgD family transcriptional regulator
MRKAPGTAFDAVLVVDDERRYVQANEPATRLLGASREYLFARTIEDLTSPQFEVLLPGLWSAFEQDGALRGAYEVRRGDGSTGMIEFNASWDLFPGQHLIVARDLSEAEALPGAAGVGLVDPRSGDLIEASPELCRLLGRAREDVLDAGLDAFGGRARGAAALASARAIASGASAEATFDCTVERADGGVRALIVRLRPVFGAQRRPIRIMLEAIPVAAAPIATPKSLSAREREVLQLAADGLSLAEIAERLVLSTGTVRTHFRNIYAKLGTRDRAAAVAEGMRRALIE